MECAPGQMNWLAIAHALQNLASITVQTRFPPVGRQVVKVFTYITNVVYHMTRPAPLVRSQRKPL